MTLGHVSDLEGLLTSLAARGVVRPMDRDGHLKQLQALGLGGPQIELEAFLTWIDSVMHSWTALNSDFS